MSRLSRPLAELKPHYEAVVVGSGYGAAIAASRLARAGRKVCLLERGREIAVGDYPNDPLGAAAEFQLHHRGIPFFGKATGLYDIRVDDDITVALGCGLGGTSLINANVALQPDPRVFADLRWPAALRADVAGVAEGYRRAREMLEPVPYPPDRALSKLDAHARSARATGGVFSRPPVAVTFADRINHAGVAQRRCTDCGDCCTGCNIGAKNTLLMNYLPDAVKHGAEVFTQALVRSVAREGQHWRIDYAAATDPAGTAFAAATRSLTSDIIMLGAGSLGSTEILLRSRANGLRVSRLVGERFTSNGDVLAFSFNSDTTVNGVGFGPLPQGLVRPVGPCIAGLIDLRAQGPLDSGFVIEEGSIPGALGGVVLAALSAAGGAAGMETMRAIRRMAESIALGPYAGAMNNTQTYLVMAHDDGAGRMLLDNDRLGMRWPGVGRQAIFQKINATLLRASDALGGTFVANPVWSNDLLANALITVHPLGGCAMGNDAAEGVVNERLQVFAGEAGDLVHPGLFVVDGAVMPRPLGVNPFLTISALAERALAKLAADRGWAIDYS